MDVGEFNKRRLYTWLRQAVASTSASCAISAVAELLVYFASGLKELK